MKTLLSAMLALLAGVALGFAPPASARTVGSGNVITESRAVGTFDAISASGSIDVVVRQAASEAVQVQAEDNLLPLVETVVEPAGAGQRLAIRFRRGESIGAHKPVRVTVDVVRLSAIAMSGSGDVVVEALKTPALRLALSGSSDARLAGLATERFELAISGSSDVVAAGQAREVAVAISGSGDADLGELVADDVSVRIAGSGDASVNAAKSLDVSIAGSGDVRYTGAATALKTKTAGSGTVSRR
jgi:hypothetical protein